MDDANLVQALEEVAQRLGAEVRVERLRTGHAGTHGGLVRLNGKPVILVDAHASLPERIAVLADAVSSLDVEALFVPPALRERIARARKTRGS